MNRETVGELQRLLEEKRADLVELRRKLPAHSIRPHQLIEIEELEDEIAELKARLTAAAGPEAGGGA